MPAQLKKLNTYNKPFWTFILSPKRLAFLAICAIIFTGFLALRLQTKVFATTGINQTINFQGKVVNKDGTNVADGQYTFVFKIWDASSGGSNLWTETQNNVQVTAGIFRVSLGSVTPITGVDFNTDNIYLGINFNSDGEMTPRVRFASVPYAFNAQKVAGLTVTDTTGTLTIPNSKVVQFGGAFQTSAQDLTLTLTGGTNVTLPTSGTLATLGGTENLSNKTFTSTVTISGVTTDITTGSNEVLTVTPNGTGNVLINPSAGGQAALIVDKNGLGDVFSASVSGATKFVVTTGGSLQLAAGAGIDAFSSGALSLGNGSNTSSLTLGRASAGITLPGFDCSGSGNGGKLTTTSGGVLTCSADGGGAGGDNWWQLNTNTGVLAPGNLTTDLLLGGTSTQSAKFSFLQDPFGTSTPVASVSAISGTNINKGMYISGDGSLQSVRNNTLTIGGNTTGNINLSPNNGTGAVMVNGTLTAKTGRGATLIVAASDSSAIGKAQADYVATGTNDDVTIETAIAALPATGGSVVLLDGTYNIGNAAGDGIDISKSNVSIIGSGKSTILKRQGDTASNDGVIAATSVSRITIADLTIDGTKATYTGTQNRGIYFSSAVTNSQIRNTYIHDNDGTGIYIDSSSNNNTFKDNDLQSNGEYGGIVIVSSNSNVISGNNLQSNTTYGVWLVAATNNTVVGNNAQANTGTGIEMFNGANNNTITGNIVQSNTQIGISIDTCNNNIITGNKLHDNTGSGVNSSIVLTTADGNTIANNDITDTAGTGYAINISDSASDNNYLTGNRYSGTGAANISNSGTGTILASQLANSGNDLILSAARYLGIGTVAPTSVLSVVGGTMGGNAAFILNQTGNSNNDILAASASGNTKFLIKNDGTASTSGNFVINAAGSLQTTNNQKLTVGGSSTGDISLMPRNGSGFVGINNASPAYPLDLLSTTNPQVRFGYDTSNYMTLQIGSSGVTTFDAIGSGAAFNFKDTVSLGVSGASNGILQFNNTAGGTAASITTNASGDLILQSSGGIVNLGVGSGDITIDPGTNNIVANLTSGNFFGQKNGTNLISLSTSGTLPVASFSGTTSFAGLLVDNSGVGNLFTASTSGLTRFTITNNGTASSSAGFTVDGNGGVIQSTKNQSLTLGGGTTGELTIGRTSQRVFLPGFDCSGSGNGGKLTTTAGGVLTCAADTSGVGGGGDNFWQYNSTTGIVANGNLTTDLLLGSTATATAKFAVLGVAGTNVPTASISAQNASAQALVLGGDGTIQSVRNNTLTFGGNTTGNIALAEKNIILNSTQDGGMSGFTTSGNTIPTSVYQPYVVSSNGFMYVLGGYTGLGYGATTANSYYTRINANGSLDTFQSTTALPSGRAGGGAIVVNGYIFVIGGDKGGSNSTDEVWSARINPDGTLGTWKQTYSMPGTRQGIAVTYANGYVYAVGGWSAGTQSSVFYAKVNGDGTLGPWKTANFLNNSVWAPVVLNANGYIYVLGGSDTFVAKNYIQYAKLNTDGSTGPWISSGVTMPVAIEGGVGAVQNGYLYYFTGATGDEGTSTQVTTIYYMKPSAVDGSIPSITTDTATVAGGRWSPSGTVVNGYVYLFGGESNGTTITNTIQYGSFARTSIAANLDLLGLSARSLASGSAGAGGSIYAGNIFSNGNLEVLGDSQLWSNVGIGGTLSLIGSGNTQSVSPLLFAQAGTTGKALAIFDQLGSGDIFAASSSGVSKFVIKNDGTASTSAGFTIDASGGNIQATRNQSLTIGGGSTGELTIGKASQKVWLPGFDCSGSGNGGKLTTTSGGVLTCAADGGSAGAAGTWTLDAANGIHTPINNTADLLVGGTSTQSAMFSVLGIAAGTNPSASVSALTGANANKAIYMSGDGSLQSVRNNFLTLGGNTTGDIYLRPLNGSGMVRIIHGTTGTGGLMLGDSETDATQKVARIKSMPYNNSSLPITMMLAINSSTGNVINIGGGSGSEYAATGIYFKTATDQTTTTGTNRLYVGGASGFVGIGDNNTTPVARLDVVDDATDINGEKLALRRTGAGDVGISFQQNGISAFGIVNRSGVGGGLAFVDNYWESNPGTEIARFYASAGVGIGTLGALPTATLDVRGVFTDSGTLPLGRFTGTTSFAGLAVNNSGAGELFTASSSGVTRFTINNAGAIGVNGSYGALGQCLLSNGVGSGASWGGCVSGPGGNWYNLISSQGTIVPINQTLDLLWGGNSTASAGFRIAGATKNYGTVAAASVSANTSFAGFVVDNRGTGELLTASSSGLTRFTIYNSGNVVIGNGPDSGFKLDVKGSVRIGNNTSGDDIVKQTTNDFTQSGYSITTSDGVNDVDTSNNQIQLVTDLIGAGGTTAAPAAGPGVGQNVGTNALTFQRPDRDFVLVTNGGTRLYNPDTNVYGGAAKFTTGNVGAGLAAFQRADGNFVVVLGGGTASQIYAPGGSTNESGTFTAGPATTANVGAGSVVIRRSDGKVLVIHGGGVGTTSVYDPTRATGTSTIGTFITGPAIASGGTVTTGSFQFGLPNGKWIVGLGGSTTTNIYDPSVTDGGGSGGTFTSGPALSAASGAGAHVIQLPDGRMMVILGGTTGATSIYNPTTNAFTAGPTLASAQTVGAGGHSFQRSDGKWVVVLGGGSTNLQLYDPTNGADGAFSTLASGLTGAGAGSGAHTFQRADGMYVIVNANSQSTTTLYDAGWNTSGTWTSEDLNSTKISTYSAMLWSANEQSANNNARLEQGTLTFSIKTADSQANLSTAPWVTLNESGLLIKAVGGAAWAKIKVDFSTPVRSYPQAVTGVIFQRNIWAGEGEVFYRRTFIQPAVFSIKVQNPLVSYGDPSGNGDPGFGRNFATASATLEGVITDNSNRLTLATNRNLPTASGSAGLIIASASANLGANAQAGTHTIERNNGKFLVIIGGSSTTRVYDSDTGTFSAGPSLPSTAGAGAHSFLLPDGRFFTVLGGTTNSTAIFDPQANVFYSGPNLYGSVGLGANTFQRPDGFFIIVNGGVTTNTNILDPFTMSVTQGPFTLFPVGGGGLNIKRPDGRIMIMVGNGLATTQAELYDAATNTFTTGPSLTTGNLNNGSTAVQLASGRWWIKTATTVSQLYDPYYGTFAVGPTGNGTITAGAVTIPRSDGKFAYLAGSTQTTIDGAAIIAGVAGPALPCTLAAGSNVFQRPTGEFVVICGNNSANTFIVDAGWNLGGTYTSEPIYEPNLSGQTGMYWKNSGQGSITVKYRTASTLQSLGATSWKQLPNNGSLIAPSVGDVWFQTRIDLQGVLQDLPGAKTRVWLSESNGGAVKYFQQIQAPTLQYWKLMNASDPNLLTITSNGSDVFRFNADGQAFTSDGGAWNSGGADLAERYQSQDALSAGEVVSLDRFHPQNTKRSTTAYDQNAMGVVSTQPGFVAGAYTENSYPIALVGRVPVKVSTENGEIHAGDYLTSASIPGYAMKATVAGRVIGQAMEDFTPDQVQECPKFGAGSLTTTQCGTITVFVNLTSYNGESVEVAMKDQGYALKEEELPAISGMDFAPGTESRRQQEVLGFLRTQKDNGQSIYTDRVAATQEVISPQIVTDLLVAKKIKAESIEGLEIITNSIESLSSQLATGSASSLRAGSAVTSFSDRLNLLALNQQDFETQISSLSAKLDKMSSLNILSFIAQGSASGELTMVNNFASYGTTTLSEASVLNTITIGTGSTLNLSNNSLYTLGDDLSIQPFRQGGVNFLGGLIKFDTDGKATFGEDVAFEKNVGVKGVLSAHTVSSTELQLGQGTTTVISDTEVTATAAAGLVTLKKNTDHVKVNNPLVKDNSFVFITPKTKTQQQLFLLDQVEGTSFTVGVDGKATEDIKFNYLIVN